MNENEFRDKLNELIFKSWTDPEFAAAFQADPAGVLKRHGITLKKGAKAHVHFDTESEKHVVIPLNPLKMATSEIKEELQSLARLHSDILCSKSWAQVSPSVKTAC